MVQRIVFTLLGLVVATTVWGQEATRWSFLETKVNTDPTTISYTSTSNGPRERVLTCQKRQRTLTSVVDETGATLRWTKKGPTQDLVELSRHGREFVVLSAGSSTAFLGSDLPWVQDLNQLGPFVVGSDQEFRFVALADFLDARLKAADMTAFKASKVKKEPQKWGSGSGLCWRVRVTFDDFRAAFWGADYWFRVSDGQMVRYEEVRGGPGTPVTVGILASEDER